MKESIDRQAVLPYTKLKNALADSFNIVSKC